MMESIKLIAFISLAVIAIIIIIALFSKGGKDRVLNEIEKLQVAFNEIRTTPLSLKFNTAQAVAKRNSESDEEIKKYYSRYTETQTIIDEIDNILVNVETYKQEHNYKEIKRLIPELQEKIGTCEKEIRETDEFLRKYESKDEEQREYSTDLKQKFQVVRDTIRKNMNQLSISYDAVENKLEEISSLFTKSEDAMFANDFVSAQETLEKIDKSMHAIKKLVNEIPSISKELTIIIPQLIEQAESSSSYIKQKGVYLDHLHVRETLEKASAELKECVSLASQLQIMDLSPRIQDVKNEVTSLNTALVSEDDNYVSAKRNMEEAGALINELKSTLDFIKTSTENNSNLYSSNDEKPNTEIYESDLANIKATYLDLSARFEILTEPASSLNENIEEVLRKVRDMKEEVTTIKEGLDKSVGDVLRAKANLIKFQLVINQAEISVKAAHLPSISASFSNDLTTCKEKIKEIKVLLDEPKVNLDELNTKIKESMDFIYNFSNNVKNLVGLSIMTENAIVFGNKFRSSHEDIDADLSKSEFAFLNGEYTKAVQLAIKTMDTLYPNSDKEIKSGNN